MATAGSLGAQGRRAHILATLRSEGAVTLDALAEALDVSVMTVRRDLDELDAEGLLRRVRGGAVAAAGPRPFGERRSVRTRAKQLIAAKALDLVPSDGAVAFDASSTVGILAASLTERRGLTIATNSYESFAALRSVGGVVPVLVGGEAEPTTGSLTGRIACDGAAAFLYRRLFASAAALDTRHGSSEVSAAESQVKRAFGERSTEIVLCVDSAKLGERSVAVGFALEEVALLITELDPSDERLDPFRDRVDLR